MGSERTVGTPFLRYSPPRLFLLHGVDQLKQLGSVHDLNEGSAIVFFADNVKGRGVLQTELVPGGAVGLDQGSQFPVGIDNKRQVDLVGGGEFLGEGSQVLLGDFQLMLEAAIAELVADRLRMGVEVAS